MQIVSRLPRRVCIVSPGGKEWGPREHKTFHEKQGVRVQCTALTLTIGLVFIKHKFGDGSSAPKA